jgi:hypothetical protein
MGQITVRDIHNRFCQLRFCSFLFLFIGVYAFPFHRPFSLATGEIRSWALLNERL